MRPMNVLFVVALLAAGGTVGFMAERWGLAPGAVSRDPAGSTDVRSAREPAEEPPGELGASSDGYYTGEWDIPEGAVLEREASAPPAEGADASDAPYGQPGAEDGPIRLSIDGPRQAPSDARAPQTPRVAIESDMEHGQSR